jgi:hypothetical protein
MVAALAEFTRAEPAITEGVGTKSPITSASRCHLIARKSRIVSMLDEIFPQSASPANSAARHNSRPQFLSHFAQIVKNRAASMT